MELPEEKAKALIDYYHLSSPDDLNLEEIANAERLIIEEADLTGCMSRITFTADYGLITIDSKIKEEGQKRFSIGHELGHFFHEKDGTAVRTDRCTAEDLFSFTVNKTREDRANTFATELLMYAPWYGAFIRGRAINFELIKEIAWQFRVSLTAAAIRYAGIGTYPVAVILSTEGKTVWSCINRYFPYRWIPKGYRVRKESAAYDFFALTPYPSPQRRGEYKDMQTCNSIVITASGFSHTQAQHLFL
jgi:Zn-dependent peptidase ImmA (M78 family)